MRRPLILTCWPLLLLAAVCSGQKPSIAGFSPTSGPVGTSITITGSNFSTTTANNIVYFGSVRATVTAAAANSLTVTAPDGATLAPISVTINGLTGWSTRPFITTFAGGSANFTTGSFVGGPAGPTGLYPRAICIADFDGDGKPDLATAGSANYPTSTVSVMRNTGTAGDLSFSTNMDLPVPVNGNAFSLAVADIDGDGKLDLVLGCIVSNTISIYLNTSTPGNISFAASVDFVTSMDPYGLAVGDLDGDGKADIAVADFLPGTVSIFRNTSTPGNVSLANRIEMPTGIAANAVAIGDIDGDGKPDLAVVNSFSSTVSLFRNQSIPGSLVFSTKTDIVTGTDYPFSVILIDLDGDGRADLAISNENLTKLTPATVSCSVFLNGSSPGAFSFGAPLNIGTGDIFALSISDMNGDGKPDLALPASFNGLNIYPNTSSVGSLSFGGGVNYKGPAPFTAAIADLDGDGLPDLAAANVAQYGFSTWINRCNKTGISRFFPTIAPIGVPVLITGANFTGATSVLFGGTPSASFTVLSDTAIRAIVGSGSSGSVSVIAPKGTATLTGFIFAGVPTISGFTPASASQGETVTVTGTYLSGTSALQFGGVNARSFSALSDSTLTAVVDSGASGNIVLATPGGTATAAGFDYTGPIIDSYTPTAANAGTTVTITGTHLYGASAVTFGGIPAASFTVISATDIQAVVGPGATGNLQVVVDEDASTRGGFIFTGPTIDSFAPATCGTGTVVRLRGTNFSGATAVTFGGTPAASFTIVNDSTITASIGIGASGNVQVTTPMGVATANGFTYTMLPVITGFSPVRGPVGSSLTITGANFSSNPASNIVYLGSVKAAVTAASSNALVVTVPTGTDNDPITVTTNGETAYANGPFSITFDGAGPGFLANSFDGKLDFPVNPGSRDILAVDLDGDGKPDLVTGNGSGNTGSSVSSELSILRNTTANGFLSFAAWQPLATSTLLPSQLAIGDFDGDGKPDLVVVDGFFGSNHFVVFQNTSTAGNISFGPEMDIPVSGTTQVIVRDIDGDGKPDIITVNNYPSFNFSILQNTSYQGKISFGPPINFFNTGPMTIEDLDGDGRPDITVLNNGYMSFYRNESTPGFVVFSNNDPALAITAGQVYGVTAGDVDADGKADLVVVDGGESSDSIYIYPNISQQGAIRFGTRTSIAASRDYGTLNATINDMDGDGSADLVVTNYYGASLSIFKGSSRPGSFSFASPFDYSTRGNSSENRTVDVDGDGRPDIVVEDPALNSLAVFRNLIGLPSTAPMIQVGGEPAICQGDSVVLTASVVSGDHWYMDNQPLPADTSRTLTVSTAGTYTVNTDVTGTLSPFSAPVTITVNARPDKPVITADTVNGLVSSADLGNQWYLDTTTAIAGAVYKTYMPADSGYYSLRVTQNGCTSDFADRYFYHLPEKTDTAGSTPTTPTAWVTPNPVTTGQITVQYSYPGVTALDVQVCNINGTVLLLQTNFHSGDMLDISSLAKGIYEIRLVDPSGRVYSTLRFIKL